MKKEDWVWMPHAGHLCVGNDCQFHLFTCVGDYVVSTVGEWVPDQVVRKIHADVHGVEVVGQGDNFDRDFQKKVGYMEIGLGRQYETMVFRARPVEDKCCPFEAVIDLEVDSDGYNDPDAATLGHHAFCAKWSEIEGTEELPPRKTRREYMDELSKVAEKLS